MEHCTNSWNTALTVKLRLAKRSPSEQHLTTQIPNIPILKFFTPVFHLRRFVPNFMRLIADVPQSRPLLDPRLIVVVFVVNN